ncbi:S-adenosyl-methyltransferase, putative [Plasmodium knowlesi strain H]|uniref:S-adenosyl-methyltransferase, putative n=3 Tax=Plasmodium knowlesi TaxID=5850 RepID=A0A5K1UH26_PLAKH|nr:S-adenosyl-methyltransferase, putative [Plasmodium knowlesi strain H]OTN63723.1 putative S-adenosyl-methyltransferase [Plasmodium knowlesi]CAA9991161.1 S-adenosyl-methyltransferase, putative [Plasmodium knowlesi strain H]SBO27132.1 S-adenosyl-methyltransferase, putative [Plasmodium knowlesi strain H]SBO29368.1 S-adenosyl-methyltransferase, putative [Plasmodium knowlesi strain H]VVS80635.1 S-adenosyl-methyltransferase, putative [Plasmodium knowlesi strain H]|eukprot:XP_002262453.1 SAM dependent methyltransferase, putative [Plasmodium knowlesi strain H]
MHNSLFLSLALLSTCGHCFWVSHPEKTLAPPFTPQRGRPCSDLRSRHGRIVVNSNRHPTNFATNPEGECQDEVNILDSSYVYHTPVLANEVIRYLRVDDPTEDNTEKRYQQGYDTNGVEEQGEARPSYFIISSPGERKEGKEKGITLQGEMKNGKKPEGTTQERDASVKPPSSTSTPRVSLMQNTSPEYYIDATLGGGGHTLEILKSFPRTSRVVAIDKDIESIYYSKQKLQCYVDTNKLTMIHGDYRYIIHLLHRHGLPLFGRYSGILLDLGVSTHQLKCGRRGFSYQHNGLLDMSIDRYTDEEYDRMCRESIEREEGGSNEDYQYDQTNQIKRAKGESPQSEPKKGIGEILNTYSAQQLRFIMHTYGQEKKAYKIAKKIVQWRKSSGTIRTTYQLRDIVLSTCKKNYKANQKVLSRVFQSFRIYINDEMKALKEFLLSSYKLLRAKKRLVVISYHSLEYKCVEMFVHSRKNLWKKINDVDITPNEEELKANKSARSAKMSVFEKI